jgi:hypothetical protein
MTTVLQITCVNRSASPVPHERIEHIGGIRADGKRWRLSQEDAIKGIEDGTYKFFIGGDGIPAWVIVAISQDGHKYLKTESDGLHPDSILSRPECP